MEERLKQAIEAFKKGDWDKAIDIFTLVLEKDPNIAEVYNNLALC